MAPTRRPRCAPCSPPLPGALALVLLASGLAQAALQATAFREAADSFTWELTWDGAAATPVTLHPDRPDPAEGWSASARAAAVRRGAVRLVFEARHACRVHDLDAPEGPLYRALVVASPPPSGARDWTRLDRRQLDHLATPKDHPDTFDLFGRWGSDPEGRRVLRLILQGGHGPPGRAKKAAKGKGG